jgi:type IV pilus assembly protein PilX
MGASAVNSPSQQKGVSLIVVLLVLVVMMTTTVGILRNSNASLGIVGNLGFKQNATSVSDQGVEAARTWLRAQAPATLLAAVAAQGYSPTWDLAFAPATFDWDANSLESTANDGTGNRVRYVIHRMCSLAGATDVANQECVSPTSVSGNGSKQLGGEGNVFNESLIALFRVTVRVDGPRNTVSYTQATIY